MSPAWKWSLFLGHWGGVSVRGHVSIAFAALFVLYAAHQSDTGVPKALALMGVVIYIASIAIHVAAHATTARRCGTPLTAITLGPWGELEPLELPRDHDHALHILLAGLGANVVLALCGVGAALLFADFKPVGLLDLLDRNSLTSGPLALAACKLTILINLVLAGLNSIPFFPFDAAYAILRVANWVDPRIDRDRWHLVVTLMGRLAGVWCLGLAPFVAGTSPEQIVAPTWLLAVLGLLLCFSPSHFEMSWASFQAGGRIQSTVAPSATRANLVRSDSQLSAAGDSMATAVRRLSEAPVAVSPEEQARLDDDRVDGILAKLHAEGIEALSSDEQETLRRVSQRYKKKRSSK